MQEELKAFDQRLRVMERMVERLNAKAGEGALTLGRKRARNEMNLVDALRKLLQNKTLSVTEITEQVQKIGYKTTSPNFRTIVNQTLINNPAFKRVARGRYTVKAGGAAKPTTRSRAAKARRKKKK
ncbi:MAG: hypothetical protein D6693_06900 [Planctomycetota bacterium]|nr:MAG: hypothetical protein D6693_06900 [Planctomycetota bacterium]